MVKKTTKKEVSKKLPPTKKLVVSETKKTSAKVKKLTEKKYKVPKERVLSEIQKQEKFWNEVDQLAQVKIYHLLTNNLPFQNSKLITEFWQYEERQQKLSGLYLHKDVDYRTVLIEIEDKYSEEELPEKEHLAEEVVLQYCHLVIKALITDLSDYAVYESYYFDNLTADEY